MSLKQLLIAVVCLMLLRPDHLLMAQVADPLRTNQSIKHPANTTRMPGENLDSIQDKTLELHGFFGEFMGKNLVYSLGYEYTFQKNKHGMGVGIGASGMKHYASGKSYPNYTFSLSPFYEYGTRFGPRISLAFAAGINPILSTGKLNYLPYADLPPVVVVMPSGSLGMFYRTRNNRFHFLISGYLIYRYSIYKERKSSRLSPWVGCSVKYNFKFR